MGSRWKLLTLLLLLGVGALIGLVFSTPSKIARLPDGARLKMLGVSRGSIPFSTEESWHKVARRIFPAKFQSLIPAPINACCLTPTNTLAVYFEYFPKTPGSSASPPVRAVAPLDDNGFQFPVERGSSDFGRAGPGYVQGFALRAYPRRQNEFNLKFFGPDDENLATVRVVNPIRGPFCAWSAEHLPILRANGRVRLELRSLTEQVFSPNQKWIRPEWHAEGADPRWPKLLSTFAEFTDPTGNQGPFLSPGESTWKLRANLYRASPRDAREDERLILKDLLVPSSGALTSIDFRTNILGIGFLVRCLAGPGRLVISNQVERTVLAPLPDHSLGWDEGSSYSGAWESWSSDSPFLLLEASNMQANDRLHMRVVSEFGRETKLDDASTYRSKSAQPSTRVYQLKFTPASNEQKVALEIVVMRPLEFEFLIDPAEISRPKSF